MAVPAFPPAFPSSNLQFHQAVGHLTTSIWREFSPRMFSSLSSFSKGAFSSLPFPTRTLSCIGQARIYLAYPPHTSSYPWLRTQEFSSHIFIPLVRTQEFSIGENAGVSSSHTLRPCPRAPASFAFDQSLTLDLAQPSHGQSRRQSRCQSPVTMPFTVPFTAPAIPPATARVTVPVTVPVKAPVTAPVTAPVSISGDKSGSCGARPDQTPVGRSRRQSFASHGSGHGASHGADLPCRACRVRGRLDWRRDRRGGQLSRHQPHH